MAEAGETKEQRRQSRESAVASASAIYTLIRGH